MRGGYGARRPSETWEPDSRPSLFFFHQLQAFFIPGERWRKKLLFLLYNSLDRVDLLLPFPRSGADPRPCPHESPSSSPTRTPSFTPIAASSRLFSTRRSESRFFFLLAPEAHEARATRPLPSPFFFHSSTKVLVIFFCRKRRQPSFFFSSSSAR